MWDIPSERLLCLVGQADSTKSTILEALAVVLSDRPYVRFDECDFHNADTTQPILIEVAVVDIPAGLHTDTAFGLHLSGIWSDNSMTHDPLDDPECEECLVIRLTVDKSMEAVWEVVRPGGEENVRISASQRALLGFRSAGYESDSDLKWGRGSALTRATGGTAVAQFEAVTEAQQVARQALREAVNTPLHEVAERVASEAARIAGVNVEGPAPGIDPRWSINSGSLVFFAGNIPLTRFGVATRRSVSLAAQLLDADLSVLAIDDVETGLDPHRMLHLLRHLHQLAQDGLQVFLTTHSPTVAQAVKVGSLGIVRSTDGRTDIRTLDSASVISDPQGLARALPSALFAVRVLVAEGKTEVGMLRVLVKEWDQQRDENGLMPAAALGSVVVNGEGSSRAPQTATALALTGSRVALLIDGDTRENDGQVSRACTEGVTVVRWPEGDATEDVVIRALPPRGLRELVEYAVEEHGVDRIVRTLDLTSGIEEFLDRICDPVVESSVREQIRVAAHGGAGRNTRNRGWFKREDHGEALGRLIVKYSPASDSDVRAGLASCHEFLYPDETSG